MRTSPLVFPLLLPWLPFLSHSVRISSLTYPLALLPFRYFLTLYSYGQTGSGKTHTMMGEMNDPEMKGKQESLV